MLWEGGIRMEDWKGNFYWVGPFRGDRAVVRIGDRWGYVNKKGKEIKEE